MESQKVSESLRQKAFKGAAYLTVRQAILTVVRVAGAFYLARVLGPEPYGLYGAAFAIFTYLQTVGLMGIDIYLIRELSNRNLFHMVFWWFLLYGTGIMLVSQGLLILIGHYWIRTEGFVALSLILCLNLPVALLTRIPTALLEQQLDYRRVAAIEVSSQLVYYLTAIPGALHGMGAWALVLGFWVSQLTAAVVAFLAARFRPRWYWDKRQLKPMLSYGFGQFLYQGLTNLQNIVPSLVLLPLAGKEAMGHWAMAERIIAMLSFIKGVAGRLSLPAFAHLQHDLARLCKAVNDTVRLQAFIMGLTYSVWSLVGVVAVPVILGSRWNHHLLLSLIAILAIRSLFSALTAAQSSALAVRKHNAAVVITVLIYLVGFTLLGYVLVAWLPPAWKVIGFGVASLLAVLPSRLVRHMAFVHYIGRPTYTDSFLFGAITGCLLFAPLTTPWLYAVAALVLALPITRRAIKETLQSLRTQNPLRWRKRHANRSETV